MATSLTFAQVDALSIVANSSSSKELKRIYIDSDKYAIATNGAILFIIKTSSGMASGNQYSIMTNNIHPFVKLYRKKDRLNKHLWLNLEKNGGKEVWVMRHESFMASGLVPELYPPLVFNHWRNNISGKRHAPKTPQYFHPNQLRIAKRALDAIGYRPSIVTPVQTHNPVGIILTPFDPDVIVAVVSLRQAIHCLR